MSFINTRRSIRKYTSKSVSESDIEEILKAGMSAPSAGNEQPWHFVVIRERQILNAIPRIHPYSEMLKEASVAVLVCGDVTLDVYKAGYWVLDCAAATENVLLAVHEKGLGAVWLGVYPLQERMDGLRKLLGIPQHIVPFSLIPIGYPNESKQPDDRFDSAKVHHNRW